MSRTLHATARHGLTAQEAIAWWTAGNHGATPVGFGYSVKTATWWHVSDGVAVTPKGAADLTRVYELVGFDGDRELRWRSEHDGRGGAVVLADLPEHLPPGECDVSRTTAFRLGNAQARILAGQVSPISGAPGWVRLTAARYAPADLPLAPGWDAGVDVNASGADTPVVVLDSVEYAEEDQHGNFSVVDRRLVRLRLVRQEELCLTFAEEG